MKDKTNDMFWCGVLMGAVTGGMTILTIGTFEMTDSVAWQTFQILLTIVSVLGAASVCKESLRS